MEEGNSLHTMTAGVVGTTNGQAGIENLDIVS